MEPRAKSLAKIDHPHVGSGGKPDPQIHVERYERRALEHSGTAAYNEEWDFFRGKSTQERTDWMYWRFRSQRSSGVRTRLWA